MNYLSVCSGIEAASVAWHPLGWEPIGFAEIEPFPSAVLAHRFPNVPNHGDMTKFKEWGIEPGTIDILVGGTPCQSFSVAGLRRGLADPRGNLMLTFGAIADYLRPSWIVWENVPGVLSSNRGRDFGTFLGMLGELGYGFAFRILDAEFYGVAQRRRRVFVVGYLGDWRRAAAVLFESEGLCWNTPPSREARKSVARGVEIGPSGGCFTDVNPTLDTRCKDGPVRNQLSGAVMMAHGQANAEIRTDGGASALTCNHEAPIVSYGIPGNWIGRKPENGGNATEPMHDIAPCLTKTDRHGVAHTAHTLRGRGFDASEDGTGRGTPLVPVAFPANLSGTQHASAENLAPSMGAKNQTAVAFAENSRSELRLEGGNGQRVGALSTGGGKPGQGAPMIAGTAVRRLTPRECERLQGFPDDWTLIPWRGKPAPDGPRYKALGNSMAVPVMRWIGERIRSLTTAST